MATKKRKTTTRRSTSRKKRAEQRLPAGLGTLFAGLLLVGLAFVEGDSVWKTLHQVLFGLFGCGSFVLGAAVCCLAVLYTRGEDLLPHICKLALGLVFASGTVIVFSDIQPQGLSAFQMVAACYQNGYQAWLSGGALGAVLGGNLLLLCGRPAANFIMLVLALCVSLYIFDLTPAEVWQWLCDVSGGVHAKGVAVYEQGAARRAERRAERQRMAIQPRRKGVQLRLHAASPPFIASAARFLRILRSTSRETTTSAASIISASIRISTGRWRVIKGM